MTSILTSITFDLLTQARWIIDGERVLIWIKKQKNCCVRRVLKKPKKLMKNKSRGYWISPRLEIKTESDTAFFTQTC